MAFVIVVIVVVVAFFIVVVIVVVVVVVVVAAVVIDGLVVDKDSISTCIMPKELSLYFPIVSPH